ncbi:aminotransferase class V-fold PLP-dependent enzyme [Burkholderia plantarii]|uniref:aminotransferase class V-fold PLP-dependent enzyme n=1 Tax=Burkholderia plantarii TaxID=41899 RepID=UPI0018DC4C45|nr:aminotransferase class V-fold PLP-dependent enzyme [Burkholderia plantarii]MBI0328167.1 aminotransferase class V-fold PLP-dependent enzyme [Burkholderia plantarii]
MTSALSPAAVDALRAATPGIAHTTHFNHGGASLPSARTLEAVQTQLTREAAMGPMEAGAAGVEQSERARGLAARLLNAQPAEIALTTSSTHGWGLAFDALGHWRAGDRILVARQEWGSNLATLRIAAQRDGVSIETIPCDATGAADPEALAALLDERVRLIVLTWMPANGGLINPAAAIGRIARHHGIPYFVDAAQTVGQLPIDVAELGADVLVGTGRKALRGPRGTGLLYIRQDFLPRLTPSFVDVWSAPFNADGNPVLRHDAARFETGDTAYALRCGLANALDEALTLGIDVIRASIDAVATTLRERLAALPGVSVLDLGAERSGLVSFEVAGIEPAEVRRRLAEKRISIASNGLDYTPLDMEARGLREVARASVSYLTTEGEIDTLLAGLDAIRRE